MKSIWSIEIAGRLPMIRVRQFIDNPAYIWHFCKRFFWYKRISHRYIPLYRDFTFLPGSETIKKLLNERLCLARFSDGEIDLMTGMGVFDPGMAWSQSYSHALQEALEQSVAASHPRLLVAHTAPGKFLLSREEAEKHGVSYTMWTDTRMLLHKYLKPGVAYGDAHSFIPRDNPEIDWREIRRFLKAYDVVVVTGGVESLRRVDLGRRTFFIEAGKHDAFSRYDNIVSDIMNLMIKEGLSKEHTLIMASLGPTASVLAVDLCRRGYFIWDSGHIFKYAASQFVKS